MPRRMRQSQKYRAVNYVDTQLPGKTNDFIRAEGELWLWTLLVSQTDGTYDSRVLAIFTSPQKAMTYAQNWADCLMDEDNWRKDGSVKLNFVEVKKGFQYTCHAPHLYEPYLIIVLDNVNPTYSERSQVPASDYPKLDNTWLNAFDDEGKI